MTVSGKPLEVREAIKISVCVTIHPENIVGFFCMFPTAGLGCLSDKIL